MIDAQAIRKARNTLIDELLEAQGDLAKIFEKEGIEEEGILGQAYAAAAAWLATNDERTDQLAAAMELWTVGVVIGFLLHKQQR